MVDRKITATAEQLYGDGRYAAERALTSAIDAIDGKFGAGYSRDHAELVAAFVIAATEAGGTANLLAILQTSVTELADAVERVAESIEQSRNAE